MTWHTGRLVAFDLETTGIDPETDRIVTAAVIAVGGGQDTETHTWLADPGIDIPDAAARVHGITTEHARVHGMDAAQAVDGITAVLAGFLNQGAPVVGHNIGTYDLTLLDRECRRHGLPPLLDRNSGSAPWAVVDTRTLDTHVLPFRRRVSATQGARQLITVAQVYGYEWDDAAAHGCEYDALMAARVAWRIGQIASAAAEERPDWVRRERRNRFDDLAGLDLEGLHQAQVKWAAEQAASLQEYLRKADPTAVVDGSWPLRPFEAGEGQ